MRTISRSALVPYAAEKMFALVDDVASYAEFLPWCAESTEHKRSDDIVEATLELQKGGIRRKFTTRNQRDEFTTLQMELLEGPFHHLQGAWTFTPLAADGCKVALNLEFEIQNKVLDMTIGPVFESICNSLVDAFTKRASDVYG